MRCSQSLPFSKLNKPNFLNFSSLERCASPLIFVDLLQPALHPSCTAVSRPGCSNPDGVLQGQSRGEHSPLLPCWSPLTNWDTAGLPGCKSTLEACIQLFAHRNSQAPLCRVNQYDLLPICTHILDCPQPKYNTLYLALLSFIRFSFPTF